MADLLFINGTVLTMDPHRPAAEALAVRAGRIVALGATAEILAWRQAHSEVIDLQGRCLVPGFHDSHLHLGQHGLALTRLRLHDVPTLALALARIAAHAQTLAPDTWLLGAGFAMSRWGVSSLSKHDLDRVVPSRPVLLLSQDHHSAWVNSRALALAGISAGTPDPEDGVIVRDASGEPSGVLLERAVALVRRVVPEPSDAELAAAVWRAGQDLARYGITTAHHMAYESPASFRQLALAASREDYPLRVWACLPQEDAEHAKALGIATGQGGERFAIGGAKFFADGALGSLTAWMLTPYIGTDTCGVPVHGPEVLAARLPAVIEAGLTPVIHAIGDAANRAALDALEASRSLWQAKGLRPRIEHAQHLHPDDQGRFAALGVIASMQPIHLTFDQQRIRELLPDRLEWAYVWRTLHELGTPLAFGSDTPVASPDVLAGLRAATERQGSDGAVLGPNERLGVTEALAAYTRGAAYAIAREHRSGQLSPGYDADLVVLSHDPRKDLTELAVEGTLLAGRWTYRAMRDG